MKKLLGIVVLGLLLSNNAYAAHSEKIDLNTLQLKCDGIKLKVVHVGANYYLYIKNPTKKKITINYIKFLTKDDDVMTTSKVTKVISPFHKDMFWLKKSKLMHQYLQKIIVGCDSI